MAIIPVILSGGAGSRLWPASRAMHPKPFLRLPDGETLLGKTYARACALAGDGPVLTVTNRDLQFQTADEFHAVCPGGTNVLLLEPFGRDTAAAIALSALYVAQNYGADALMLVMPADHLIHDATSFSAAVARASELARTNKIVTFGIKPTRPDAGYGYIETDGDTVTRFVEKPDAVTAAGFIATGKFFWNAGLFCFSAQVMIDAMQALCPDIVSHAARALAASAVTGEGADVAVHIDASHFARVPAISIDYAVMERAPHLGFVPCNFEWSDIGSWAAMAGLTAPDENGNRIIGDVALQEANGCFVQSAGRLVGLVGVSDLIVVDTPDALLVVGTDSAQSVKMLYDKLKAGDHASHAAHRTVHRPWGTYTVLEEGAGFKIKRIVVKPAGRLSLQSHRHRAEHWVVVSGRARVTNGGHSYFVEKNESTFIPLGARHRLENCESEPLIMIEVQSGDYLSEDDITRYDGVFSRLDG